MEDGFDIYSNLEDFDYEIKYKEKLEEIEELKKTINSLNIQITTSNIEFKSLKKVKKNLQTNCSSLLATAKTEIRRKDKVISDYQSLENQCYKKGRYLKPISNVVENCTQTDFETVQKFKNCGTQVQPITLCVTTQTTDSDRVPILQNIYKNEIIDIFTQTTVSEGAPIIQNICNNEIMDISSQATESERAPIIQNICKNEKIDELSEIQNYLEKTELINRNNYSKQIDSISIDIQNEKNFIDENNINNKERNKLIEKSDNKNQITESEKEKKGNRNSLDSRPPKKLSNESINTAIISVSEKRIGVQNETNVPLSNVDEEKIQCNSKRKLEEKMKISQTEAKIIEKGKSFDSKKIVKPTTKLSTTTISSSIISTDEKRVEGPNEKNNPLLNFVKQNGKLEDKKTISEPQHTKTFVCTRNKQQNKFQTKNSKIISKNRKISEENNKRNVSLANGDKQKVSNNIIKENNKSKESEEDIIEKVKSQEKNENKEKSDHLKKWTTSLNNYDTNNSSNSVQKPLFESRRNIYEDRMLSNKISSISIQIPSKENNNIEINFEEKERTKKIYDGSSSYSEDEYDEILLNYVVTKAENFEKNQNDNINLSLPTIYSDETVTTQNDSPISVKHEEGNCVIEPIEINLNSLNKTYESSIEVGSITTLKDLTFKEEYILDETKYNGISVKRKLDDSCPENNKLKMPKIENDTTKKIKLNTQNSTYEIETIGNETNVFIQRRGGKKKKKEFAIK